MTRLADPEEDCGPRRRTQAQRRDASQRLLVEATMDVVAGRGVNAATFEAIGQAAGYSRGLATQRFGSKRGLIDAVIDYLHQRRNEILEAHHVAEMSALDAVLYYVDSHFQLMDKGADDQVSDGRAYFMLLAGAVADASSLRTAFADSHDRVRAWLAGVIVRGQADRSLRPDLDPDGAALMIGSLLLGVSIQWLVDPAMAIEPIRRASLETIRLSFATAHPGAPDDR